MGGTDGRVAVVTDATFMDLTEGGWTLVDFSAGWCGPCRVFTPVFRDVAQGHDGPVRFGVCDIDTSPQVAALLQVRSVPTVVAFGPDGSEVGRHPGALRRGDLEATVEQLRARAGGTR